MEDKTMKKVWKNEEGVSPVIAVILMVAIAVVLALIMLLFSLPYVRAMVQRFR